MSVPANRTCAYSMSVAPRESGSTRAAASLKRYSDIGSRSGSSSFRRRTPRAAGPRRSPRRALAAAESRLDVPAGPSVTILAGWILARSRNRPTAARRGARNSPRVLADLVRDRLVALALHDVQRRLRDDELRERAHHDRVAQVVPHARDLLHDLGQPVLRFPSSAAASAGSRSCRPESGARRAASYVATRPRGLPSRTVSQSK